MNNSFRKASIDTLLEGLIALGDTSINQVLELEYEQSLVHELRRVVSIRWPEVGGNLLAIWKEVFRSDTRADVIHNIGVALWATDNVDGALRAFVKANREEQDMDSGSNAVEAAAWRNAQEDVALLIDFSHGKDSVADKAAGIRGEQLLKSSQPAAALDLLARGNRVDSRQFGADYGIALRQLGRLEDAIIIWQQSVDAESADAPILLGNVLADEGADDARVQSLYELGVARGWVLGV
ncbi:hypothetical protein QT381_15380 [Galbitalea sp. SE-J8]|uniref:hypothetical protein n=1 Tax=Galbitalea sp. SE-J8 TaxID=3054952 RepID=UPI00259D04C1|nr:hypothetical protein [Galbitalea sp. SE-J8]MDM4764381.1 hypothetical protein [Galbitalea sp. SE-J8]